MVSSIEVLKGSGSALYGSDAIGGVVNIRTEPISPGEFRLLAGMGNFGFNQQHAVGTFGKSWWQEELSFARDFSSGFTADRDYRNLSLGSLSTLKSRLGATSLLFAYSDRPFGADNFYGVEEPQWERVKTWFGSVHQNLGPKTEASFAFRKHTDLYVYIRDNPSFFSNRHTDESWQGNVRRHDNLPLHAVISYGLEGLSESVNSTNLLAHSRKRGSGYIFYDLRSVRRYSLSAGIREEVYGAHSVVTSLLSAGQRGSRHASKCALQPAAHSDCPATQIFTITIPKIWVTRTSSPKAPPVMRLELTRGSRQSCRHQLPSFSAGIRT